MLAVGAPRNLHSALTVPSANTFFVFLEFSPQSYGYMHAHNGWSDAVISSSHGHLHLWATRRTMQHLRQIHHHKQTSKATRRALRVVPPRCQCATYLFANDARSSTGGLAKQPESPRALQRTYRRYVRARTQSQTGAVQHKHSATHPNSKISKAPTLNQPGCVHNAVDAPPFVRRKSAPHTKTKESDYRWANYQAAGKLRMMRKQQ